MTEQRRKLFSYDIYCLIAGALLPLAFAPFFALSSFAILCPAFLLFSLEKITAKHALKRGFLFGIGFFAVGASWIYVSIHDFGNTNWFIAGFITAIFVLLLALLIALQCYVLQKLFPKPTISRYLIAFPVLWVLFEVVRSYLFSGFPWLLIGHSQIESLLKYFLPIIGIYGVSFLTTLLSGAFVIWVLSEKKFHLPMLMLIIVPHVMGFLLQNVTWTHAVTTSPLKLTLVQGNIAQTIKWSADYLDHSLRTYEQLTNQHWDSDVIIWPEAAIPLPLSSAKNYVEKLDNLAKQHQVALVVGLPIEAENNQDFFNSALVLGDGEGRYDKKHLVPFGEYVPFSFVLRGLINFFDLPMSNFIPGSSKQPTLVVKDIPIATFICYEIAYNHIVRSQLPTAQMLVTMSNDAWFGHSFAPAQHLQIAQAQAMATGRPIAFVANDGITAFINARGKIEKHIPRFKMDVLKIETYPVSGYTPWSYFGDYPIFLLLIILIIAAKIKEKRDNKKPLLMQMQ